MKLIIKSEDTPHYRSHGFGALMNKSLRLCWLHHEKYGNWDIEFQDYQLQDLFINPQFLNNLESYTKDLIWDGDGPKDIDKNRLAFDSCFRDRCLIGNTMGVYDWIGVHARGTDKATECKLVSIKDICHHINKFNDRIFLATEDQKRFLQLKAIYGKRIVSSCPINLSHHVVGDKRLKINKDAYIDARILSRSKVFLACNSNLSELVKAMRHPDLPVIDMQIL